jgi:23S rRNA (uracil1939-C5)-methyltransferase
LTTQTTNRGIQSSAKLHQIDSWGENSLTYTTDSAAYRVSMGAFFQVNRYLIEELVKIVTQGLSGRTALDLYAGVGLFSAILARNFAQVTAVESSPTAYADLLYNLPSNAQATSASVEHFLENAAGGPKPDLVVADPPRSGLGEKVVHDLVRLAPACITYVSCDPATLARDLVGLMGNGYRIARAHMVDLFPQTYHLESVFQLVR